jgi:rhodanese-related sulfurtransferase
MKISFSKILVIIVFAIALTVLMYFLNSDTQTKTSDNQAEQTSHLQQSSYDSTEIKNEISQIDSSYNSKTNKDSYNEINPVPKSSTEDLSDKITAEYDFSKDSLQQMTLPQKNLDMNTESVSDFSSSNLTKEVFNQPRLISLNQAYELYRDKILFADARNPEEFEDGHISGAINLPYFTLNNFEDRINSIDKTAPIVTYCEGADCDMSIRLGNELFQKGFKKVFVFFGGWEEWKKAQYPVFESNSGLNLN